MIVFWERLFFRIMAVSAFIAVMSYFVKDGFPSPDFYSSLVIETPTQTATTEPSFKIQHHGEHYLIEPKYNYELTGMVVSTNDASQFGNIWHHRRWKDYINVRDICVIWGDNIEKGVYKELTFSSDSWTCWVSYNNAETAGRFQSHQLSNNHVLTNMNDIKKRLLSAEIGDVVQFSGWLSDYKNINSGISRVTSTTRNDQGNGACEVVFINEFEIVKKANTFWRNLYWLSKWCFLVSCIGFLIMFIQTPVKNRL